jgi:hypothetical protein
MKKLVKNNASIMGTSKIHGVFIILIFKLPNQTSAIARSAGSSKGFAVEINAKVI